MLLEVIETKEEEQEEALTTKLQDHVVQTQVLEHIDLLQEIEQEQMLELTEHRLEEAQGQQQEETHQEVQDQQLLQQEEILQDQLHIEITQLLDKEVVQGLEIEL